MKFSHLTLAVLAVLPAPALAGTVSIDISGVRAGTGDLYVSLQTREQFMKPQGTTGEIVTKPAPGSHSVTLSDVPAGTYSVSVWHDANGNKRWDGEESGGAGPFDGWSMVNADKLRAEPKFDEVSFQVSDAPLTLKLPVRYGYGR